MRSVLGMICAFFTLPLLNASAQQLPVPHEVGSTVKHHVGSFGSELGASGSDKIMASEDGRFLVTSNGAVWNLTNGGMVANFGKRLRAFTVSRRGTWVAFAEQNSVKVWQLTSGEVRTLITLDTPAEQMAGSPDEKTLAVVTRTGNPRLLNVPSGDLLGELVWSAKHRPLRRDIATIGFSRDGAYIACDTEVWNVATRVSALQMEPSFRAFLNGGRSVLALLDSRHVEEFEIATSKKTSSFDLVSESSSRTAFSSDGRFIAVSEAVPGNSLVLWDAYAGLKVRTIVLDQSLGGYNPAFIGVSDWLIGANAQDVLQLVRISTGAVVATLFSDNKDWAVMRTADGAYDGSAGALSTPANWSGSPLIVDGLRVDRSDFQRVPGLLTKLLDSAATPNENGRLQSTSPRHSTRQ